MKKIINVTFIIIAILAILEYYFIAGLFTGPIMIGAICIAGVVKIFYSFAHREWNETILSALVTIAICIGYFKIM